MQSIDSLRDELHNREINDCYYDHTEAISEAIWMLISA